MFPFCCSPTSHYQRRLLRNQIHFTTSSEISSLGIDNLNLNRSSEKSLDYVKSTDLSLDPQLPQQTEYSEIPDNGDHANRHRPTVIIESSPPNSGSKLSFKLSSLVLSPPRSCLLDMQKKEMSNISLVSGSTTHTNTYAPVPMTKILPHMYIGSYDNAMDELELKAKGITHILSLMGRNWPLDFVEQQVISMHDRGRTNLKGVLEKISKFMELGQEDDNNILVHCQSGQNRSATVVIAYLLIYHNWTLYRAHKRLKMLRPLVQINEGYAKQLLALEKEIFGKNSLPSDWMERGEVNITTGEVAYKHENMNSTQHRAMFDSDE